MYLLIDQILVAMEGSACFRVELLCEEDKTTQIKSLTLQLHPDHTFLDVKKAIERCFSIPVCVQSLLHQSNRVSDTDNLLACYVRDGDVLQVTYPAEGECERVVEAVEWLKKLEDSLSRLRQYHSVGVRKNTDHGVAFFDRQKKDYSEYGALVSSRESKKFAKAISFELGYPWKNKTKYVNKLHFHSLGGTEVMMRAYSYLVEARNRNSGLYKQLFLESTCALFIANFTQTFPLRRCIVEHGGLDLCISSFLCSTKYVRFGIECETVRPALYALCNISELPECQLKLARMNDVTEQAVNVAFSSVFEVDPEVPVVSLMYFICLAQSPETHPYLLRPTLVSNLLELCAMKQVRSQQNINITREVSKTVDSYTCVLIAIMVSRSTGYLQDFPYPVLRRVVKLMESVCEWNPADISAYEVKEGLVWATFLPYITFLYHPVVSPLSIIEDTEGPELVKRLQRLSTEILLRALQNAFVQELHVSILMKEAMLDYVTALPWHVPVTCQAHARAVLKEVSKFVQIRPPSLCSLAKAKLAKTTTGFKKVMDMKSVSDLFV